MTDPIPAIRAHALDLGAKATPAARRRYWRCLAAIALIEGRRWSEAERLGAEP